MAEIKIFCVTTAISHDYERDCLKQLKTMFCSKFGGLTVIKDCEGLWLNSDNEIETDSTDIWLIEANNPEMKFLWNLCDKLRRVTKQSSQLFTIDGLSFFVDSPIP